MSVSLSSTKKNREKKGLGIEIPKLIKKQKNLIKDEILKLTKKPNLKTIGKEFIHRLIERYRERML